MSIEADLFLMFTGWSPKDTEAMSLDELMGWHAIALVRHTQAQNIG
jgi:hypothetical protein